MDRQRLDLIIDRRLRSAMTVTPSADFGARLRERLGHERRSQFWSAWPTFASSAIAAIVVAFAVAFVAYSGSEVRGVPTPATPLPQVVASSKTSIAPSVPRSDRSEGKKKRRPAHEVEVIVPRDQAAAIQRFAETLRDSGVRGRSIAALAVSDPALANPGYVFPSVPTIDQLPAAGSYDSKGSER